MAYSTLTRGVFRKVLPCGFVLFLFLLGILTYAQAPSATAVFVNSDSATQGNWTGTYGAQGYVLSGATQSLPSYDTTFAVLNESNYVWAQSTADVRALQNGGGRIAATWYSPTLFLLDVNITDGNAHQIALYCIDWDSKGRAQTISIADGSSGQQLDTRNLPIATSANFAGGVYLIWNVSGHVKITVKQASGPNAVVSGIFFDAGAQTAPQITSANSTAFTVGTSGSFTVTTTGVPTAALSESGALPMGVGFTDNGNGTATLNGTPAAGSAANYAITLQATNGVAPGASQPFTLTVNAQIVGSGPAAAFVGADTATQGNWIGKYGSGGYDIALGPQLPAGGTLSYGAYSVQNASQWPWAASTADPRALEVDSQGDRAATTWYNPTGFSFDVNFTDGGSHHVTLYAVDWDNKGRSETITISNASTGQMLDTRSIPNANAASTADTNTTSANLTGGSYLTWNVTGHVTISVVWNAGPNAVVSGIFFDSVGPVAPQITSANSTTFTAGTTGMFTVTTTGNPAPALTESGTLPMGVNFTDNGNGTATLSGPPAANSNSSYPITIQASNGDLPNATQTFTLNVNPMPGGGGGGNGPTATFSNYDTLTQGNWVGKYGGEGYSIEGGMQNLPSYDPSFAPQGQTNYTWVSGTTDVRALQNGAARVAGAWYNPSSFTLDVNITDGSTHKVSLYVLDWDSQGRGETIQILPFNSNTPLDTRTIPNNPSPTSVNFVGGVYLTWVISGHVTIKVMQTSGPNAVVSGIFFGQNNPQAPAITSGTSAIFSVGSQGTFLVTTTGVPVPSLSVSGTLPAGLAFTDNGNGTGTLSGVPTTNSGSPYGFQFVATNGVGSAAMQNFTLNVNPYGAGGATATFVKFDTATSGNWVGTYGSDGYAQAMGNQVLPSYTAAFTPENQYDFTWTTIAPDPRALQSGTGRIAAAWYQITTFSFDLNLADGNPHLFALYALDWDNQGRAEQIQIFDASTNHLLDTENISNFTYGVYVVWNITGHVTVTVTCTGGPNAVISGAFFNANLTNPAPILTAVNPTAIGLGTFTLTVSGSNFVTGSQIMFGNTPLTTTLISSSELTATGTATASQLGSVTVKVQNPAPGGGTSANSKSVLVETGQAATSTAAVRFLEQATFGPTTALLNQLEQVGFNQFLTDQFNAPVSNYPDQDSTLDMLPVQKTLFTNTLNLPDQLRQRVALALSEIWVTSGLVIQGPGMAPYMQMLTNDAFTNYRTIMQDVTLSPTMGRYLNMANNVAPDPASNQHANENYGRELMQLFTIGLIKLNGDGTPQLDNNGNTIPTYTQDQVEAFARAFTGWTYPTEPGSPQLSDNPIYWYGPMIPIAAYHDTGSKTLLNGTVLPAGESAAQDVSSALDNIFNDPDMGPFVSGLLIQHLVTSNPSPAYVSRVTSVFASGKYGTFGSGNRGDMQAVIAAILLDSEARRGDNPATAVATDGHLREPILFAMNLLRAFNAASDGVGPANFASNAGEPPLTAPSVFNFFPPNYAIPGTNLLGPEFALQTTATAVYRLNFVDSFVYGSIDPGTTVDFTTYANLAAGGVSQLVSTLNTLLMHGTLSASDQASILSAVNAVPAGPSQSLQQAQTAIYLIASSSQYQVEH